MKSNNLNKDLLASVVVFLVALPLCMGIAIASGAPPAAGLITGIIGGIVASSLGGCPLQVSGPAAGLAVLVYEFIQTHGFEMLGPVIIMAGILQIVAGALKWGQLFRAISPAVIYGMLAGIGVLIFGAQFHVMVDDKPRENGLQNLLSIPEAIYKGLFPIDGSSHHIAAGIGVGTIAVLLLWTKFAPAKLKWIPGALVGVLFATSTAALAGLQIKYVSLPDNLLGTLAWTTQSTFLSALTPTLLIAAATLAFVASAETLLSAAAVDQMQDGPRANYDRELLAQGIGNSLAGFAGGLPMTGVIVRSATNVNAGARTRLSGVLHGVWLLIMVAAFPGVLRLIPTASLAAILVYTGYKLVNVDNIKRLLRYGGFPVSVYALTVIMIVCTDLLTGIIAGLVVSLLKLIYALTHLKIETSVDEAANRVNINLIGSATFVRLPKLVDTLESVINGHDVHVHIGELNYIDHACLEALGNWERKMVEKGKSVCVEWDELMIKYRQMSPMTSNKPPAHTADQAA
ncbi:MAG TPA: SulP family inorganic anion transporter [Bryobacteraceae bacterium]|nr:SulP family inorganic anion transporter [Bryobacteraceae bacterium]